MTWNNIIVIDQGTHSTRAIIYDHSGHSIFKSQQDIDLYYRDSMHVEQNGKQILASCEAVMADANEFVNNNNLQEVAVALTTQRSTVLAWDEKTGEAITPALSWLDTRAQASLENFSMDEQTIKTKTGLPLSPHYGASKLQWLLQHDEKVQQAQQEKCLKFGPLAAYLLFNLIENQPCYVDYSNAHRTLLWNLQSKDWDGEILNAFDINASHLPEPVPSKYQYGRLKNFAYPIVLVNGDQNSAVYGYGKLPAHTTLINIGTGAFVLASSKQKPVLNTDLLASITYSELSEQEYALEGTVNGAGAAMTWAETEWNIKDIESVTWKDEENVPVFLNSVGGLGSPFWNSEVNARFIHQDKTYSDYTKHQNMAALMESIAFLLAINVNEMHKHGVQTEKLLVAGGMSKDDHLCQCLADLCRVNVEVSSFKEATSRGAAWLAMQRPNWNVLESKYFHPCENNTLQSRYEKFIKALNEVV